MPAAEIVIEPLSPVLGRSAEGVDLRRDLDPSLIARLRRALLDGLVLCVRGQTLTDEEYVRAARHFGTPLMQLRRASRLCDTPEVAVLSSEDRDALGDGKRIVVGAAWHTDDSYKAVPCSITMLYGVEIPPAGGDTQFTNMYAALEALPADLRRRIDAMRVVHKYDSSRKGNRVAKRTAEEEAETPDVVHPLVRTHPETGRKALYMNPNRMEQIVGLDRAESDRLLDELIAHATRPEFQYRHRWRQGDLLFWDNRCTMHKANGDYPEGSRRRMHRIILEGTVPV